eukprot:TRINITY_DN4078_c0_g1_i2.p1 TRINITY_DN4078_c0_g1~~TRINITY_DN4078_c0_g1_i2.p1  ORF type:complete len:319 (+),score=47.92 TRINITY_DN4078_c0_g1_i2:78-1034(+)
MSDIGGQHCGILECHQLDFLPFKCDCCGVIFCQDHRKYEHHDCPNSWLKLNEVPVCQLCQQPLPLRKGEDRNGRVDRHIQAGCPQEASTFHSFTQFACDVPGCKESSLQQIKCVDCKKQLCLRHRHAPAHECLPAKPPSTKPLPAHAPPQSQEDRAAKAAKSQASLEEFSKRAAEMAAAAQARRTPAGQAAAQAALSRHPQQGTKPAPAKPIAAPPPTTTAAPISAQVSLMKLKSAAKGDTKVAPEQRFYVQITTPIAKQPLVMFFNKEWKVGRILDAVCDAAGIQNRNHIAGAKVREIRNTITNIVLTSALFVMCLL